MNGLEQTFADLERQPGRHALAQKDWAFRRIAAEFAGLQRSHLLGRMDEADYAGRCRQLDRQLDPVLRWVEIGARNAGRHLVLETARRALPPLLADAAPPLRARLTDLDEQLREVAELRQRDEVLRVLSNDPSCYKRIEGRLAQAEQSFQAYEMARDEDARLLGKRRLPPDSPAPTAAPVDEALHARARRRLLETMARVEIAPVSEEERISLRAQCREARANLEQGQPHAAHWSQLNVAAALDRAEAGAALPPTDGSLQSGSMREGFDATHAAVLGRLVEIKEASLPLKPRPARGGKRNVSKS